MKLSVLVVKLSARFLASKQLLIHPCTNLLTCKIKVIGEKLISFCHLYRDGPGEDRSKQYKGYKKCVLQIEGFNCELQKSFAFIILYRVFFIVPPHFQCLNEKSCLAKRFFYVLKFLEKK